MQNILPYALTCIAVLFIAVGQLLFRLTASRLSAQSITQAIADPTTLWPFALAVVVYGMATVLWILALRDLALSNAYMFMAASFVIVPLGSVLFFSEHLSPGFLVGVGPIVIGLVVTQIFN